MGESSGGRIEERQTPYAGGGEVSHCSCHLNVLEI